MTIGTSAWSLCVSLVCAAPIAAQVLTTERHRLLPEQPLGRAIAADLDGDGDLDLVGGSSNEVRIQWNDGEGRFSLDPTPLPATWIAAIAAGDIDGDGDLDLVVGQPWFFFYGPGRLFRNDGPLGFTDVSSQWPTTAEAPQDLELFDYDGDGDLDLVTADPINGSSQTGGPLPFNHLYLNDGTGTFTDVTATRMANAPFGSSRVATGDIDGDGDQDIVFNGTTCRVFVQNANGVAVETPGRVPALIPQWGGTYVDVALVDVDLDFDLDLVAASSSTQGVHVFANDGLGSFTLAGAIADSDVATLHVADFDADGRPDLLAARALLGRAPLPLRLYRNTPAGFVDVTASRLEAPELAPTDLHVFDCDGDSDLDVWAAAEPQPVLWHNDSAGNLLQVTLHDLSNLRLSYAAAADIDGDGDDDLAGIESYELGSDVAQVFVVTNAGDGIGRDRTILLPWSDNPRPQCLAWIDADLDGDLDLFVGNEGGGTTPNGGDRLFHNLGGSFVDVSAAQLPTPPIAGSKTVVKGDVDGDGVDDLLTAGFAAALYRGNGMGGYVDATGVLPNAPTAVSGMALVDYDLDGDLDVIQSLASWYSSGGTFRVLRNDWPMPFVDVTASLALPPLQAWAVATIDIDRDGRLDLLVGNHGVAVGGNGLVLLRAVGQGFVDETATRVPMMATVGGITVVDLDGDGWDDVVPVTQWGDPLSMLRNTGGVLAAAANPSALFPGQLPAHLSAADFDGDSDQDVITTFGLLRNRERDLQNAAPPRLGLSAELVLHANAGDGQNAQLASLLLADAPGPSVAVPGLGTFSLDPTSARFAALRVIPATGGEASVVYVVPAQPALLGAELFAQALFVHQPSSTTWRLGNRVALRLRL